MNSLILVAALIGTPCEGGVCKVEVTAEVCETHTCGILHRKPVRTFLKHRQPVRRAVRFILPRRCCK